jgi:hypothetical protein
MEAQSILDIFNLMTDGKVIYVFHGEFNYKLVNTLLTDIKKELSLYQEKKRAAKKTYKVLVECLENIHRHTSKPTIMDEHLNEGVFTLLQNETGFSVVVGNVIQSSEVEPIKSRIEEVNLMDAEMLKLRYREMIKGATISDKGGAGLGLIDMAMKSGSQLKYNFDKHINGKHFFTLRVDILA